MPEPTTPTLTEAEYRQIAREEAESVYDELVTEDDNGERWSLRKLMDRFEIGRRDAIKAMGLIALGASAPVAVLKAISDPASAAPTDDLTVPGDLTVGGTTTTAEVNNDNYVEPQATASASTTYDADLATSNYHKVTMTGDVTFDFTNADASDTNSLVLHLVQDGTGGRTPSFTPTVVWAGGSAPSWSTGANAEDVVTFVHDQDGSQWLGFLGGIGFA